MAAKGGKRRGNTDYIVDDAARKATFKKRKKGLLKKLAEITTLCDVRACAVIYNPATEGVPDIFPANEPSVVANMITEFNNLPEEEQTRKMFNQEDFLTERISKAKEQLQRLKADNQEMRFSNTLDEYSTDSTKSFADLPIWDLQDLARLNETNYRQLNHQINNILMMTNSAPPAMPEVPEGMNNINPIPFPLFHQNMVGGGEGMVNPGFLNQGNGLVPMNTNETGFPAWFSEMMRNSQNGGAGTSNSLNIGSSSDSPPSM